MALGVAPASNYAKRKNTLTLSKALHILGHEQWSSIDKGKAHYYMVFENLLNKFSCFIFQGIRICFPLLWRIFFQLGPSPIK